MSDYTPRDGSIAHRARLALEAKGEMSTAALADEIDCEAYALQPSLTIALRAGYVAKVKRDGMNFYRVGDGQPLEVDDDPPKQRTVRADTAPRTVAGLASVFPIAPAAEQQAVAEVRAFACSLRSDGLLVLHLADCTDLTLDAAETQTVVRYLDRLAPEAAA